MLTWIRDLLARDGSRAAVPLSAEFQPLTGGVWGTCTRGTVELELGSRTLRLYPEEGLAGGGGASRDWIVVDGGRRTDAVSGFARIKRGDAVVVGRDNEAYQRIFGLGTGIKRRHLEIRNDGGRISIRQLDPDAELSARTLDDAEETGGSTRRRLENLKHVRDIYGGPIAPLSPEDGMAAAVRVNEILRDEVFRPRDSRGRPGGLLDLPDELTPVIVGDLHAQVDNLLTVLSENAFLDALARGDACLILLGDTVHSEIENQLEQMDSSILILDLIFKLKLRFPDRLFYVRGNHESFDPDVSKGGVPQGLLLRERARELRGSAYEEQLADFFELLPYVVRCRDFVACHGGPPMADTTVEDVIGICDRRDLARALVWSRPRRRNSPAGYTNGQVKAFRRCLGVGQDIPLIVGHTPLSPHETVWLDVSGIANHHIVFSAHEDKLAVFVGLGRHMVPLEYPAEPLLDLTNALEP